MALVQRLSFIAEADTDGFQVLSGFSSLTNKPGSAVFFGSGAGVGDLTDDDIVTHYEMFFGVASDDTDKTSMGVGTANENGQASADCYRFGDTTDCIVKMDPTTGSIVAAARVSSFDANSITLEWTTSTSLGFGFSVLAFDSSIAAKVGKFNNSSGDSDVNTVGFEPNVVFGGSHRSSYDSGPQSNGAISIGICVNLGTDVVQRSFNTSHDDGGPDSEPHAIVEDNSFGRNLFETSLFGGALLTDFDAQGFTAQQIAAGGIEMVFLALDYPLDVWADDIVADPSGGTSQHITGFATEAAFFVNSRLESFNSIEQSFRAGPWGLGAWALSGDEQRTHGASSDDQQDPTVENSWTISGAVSCLIDSTADTAYQGDVSQLDITDGQGFQVNYENVGSGFSPIVLAIAFEQEASATTSASTSLSTSASTSLSSSASTSLSSSASTSLSSSASTSLSSSASTSLSSSVSTSASTSLSSSASTSLSSSASTSLSSSASTSASSSLSSTSVTTQIPCQAGFYDHFDGDSLSTYWTSTSEGTDGGINIVDSYVESTGSLSSDAGIIKAQIDLTQSHHINLRIGKPFSFTDELLDSPTIGLWNSEPVISSRAFGVGNLLALCNIRGAFGLGIAYFPDLDGSGRWWFEGSNIWSTKGSQGEAVSSVRDGNTYDWYDFDIFVDAVNRTIRFQAWGQAGGADVQDDGYKVFALTDAVSFDDFAGGDTDLTEMWLSFGKPFNDEGAGENYRLEIVRWESTDDTDGSDRLWSWINSQDSGVNNYTVQLQKSICGRPFLNSRSTAGEIPKAAWYDQGLRKRHILLDDDGVYRMWLEGFSSGDGDSDIGVFESSDPEGPWTQTTDSPQITRSLIYNTDIDGDADYDQLTGPWVIKDWEEADPDKRYKVFCSAQDRAGSPIHRLFLFTAPDPNGPYTQEIGSFTDGAILEEAGDDSWEHDGINDPVIIKSGGLWYMFHSGIRSGFGWAVGLRTSEDLINWSELTDVSNPILTAGDARLTWSSVSDRTFSVSGNVESLIEDAVVFIRNNTSGLPAVAQIRKITITDTDATTADVELYQHVNIASGSSNDFYQAATGSITPSDIILESDGFWRLYCTIFQPFVLGSGGFGASELTYSARSDSLLGPWEWDHLMNFTATPNDFGGMASAENQRFIHSPNGSPPSATTSASTSATTSASTSLSSSASTSLSSSASTSLSSSASTSLSSSASTSLSSSASTSLSSSASTSLSSSASTSLSSSASTSLSSSASTSLSSSASTSLSSSASTSLSSSASTSLSSSASTSLSSSASTSLSSSASTSLSSSVSTSASTSVSSSLSTSVSTPPLSTSASTTFSSSASTSLSSSASTSLSSSRSTSASTSLSSSVSSSASTSLSSSASTSLSSSLSSSASSSLSSSASTSLSSTISSSASSSVPQQSAFTLDLEDLGLELMIEDISNF